MLNSILRHLKIFIQSWKDVSADKQEPTIMPGFLPAALEISESPASKGSRYFMWAIISLFTAVIAWSILGHVDVVVVAQGKLIPEGRVKTIQASSEGIVRNILVRDGDHVNKGDILLELNTIESKSTVGQAKTRLIASEIEMARWVSLKNYLDTGKNEITYPTITSQDENEKLKSHIMGDIDSYEIKISHLKKQVSESQAEKEVAQSQLEQTEKTLPILKSKFDIYEKLKSQGVATDIDYYDIKRQYVRQKEEVNVQKSRIEKAEASIRSVESEIEQTRADFRSEALDKLAKAEAESDIHRDELTKAMERDREHHIRAPVAGTVEQSRLTTIGAVVKGAEPLMVIVPDNATLVFEGKVRNQDIGFIEPDQAVEVKLNAFPYTRYGAINGQMLEISHDAVEDKQQGLVFSMVASIDQQTLLVNGKSIHLTSGMSGSAEIKTGKRRIIDFFLSPLLEVSSESFTER